MPRPHAVLVPFVTDVMVLFCSSLARAVATPRVFLSFVFYLANKRELVDDLIVKAKQIEVLIQSLPVPEPEETQASLGFLSPPSVSPDSSRFVPFRTTPLVFVFVQAHRLEALETAMTEANEEYVQAVDRASP